jgi:hypothetical protein
MRKHDIGACAGRVWSVLGKQKKVALTTLPKILNEDVFLVQQAIGWLAREDKIQFDQQGRTLYLLLSDKEEEVYKKTHKYQQLASVKH